MKPKGLSVDKDSPDFKKILELSADNDLLASVNQDKPKFFTYLKNKLAPIQEEKADKSAHKCQQFETATLLTTTKTTTTSGDAKDVSQKTMPTQLPSSTNLNNIESSSSQANTNLQALGKWNTTPEHIQQVTNTIEKQQLQTQQQAIQSQSKDNQAAATTKSGPKHHLPPVTRKTILGPVPQARSSISHHNLKPSELESNVNYKAIYQPVPNPMAAFSSNGQEWLVAKQRINRPKDHDILRIDPIQASGHYMTTSAAANRPITDADIRKQEFIERKIAQENYRQQLEHQIMQQKPVKPFLPRTTLRFEGEADYKTETRQNYKPFRFVTSLNDLDKRGMNEKMNSTRKQSIEKEHHTIQMHNNQLSSQQSPQLNEQIVCCSSGGKGNRPQSSLTGAKFKDHLQNQPDSLSQRRHLNQINQIESEQQPNNSAYHHHHHQQQQHYHPAEQELIEVDENNNIVEPQQQRASNQYSKNNKETFCCDHCRHHYLNGIQVPLGSATNQNQIELNPLVGVRALPQQQHQPSPANKTNRIESGQQAAKRKIKINEQQAPPTMVRSRSTHFPQQQQTEVIPRMIVPGKQKPHKNMSHLKFEGQNCFITTNNMMYRDHSMQNLSSYPEDEQRHLNRGVFAEQMMTTNGGKKSITGNIRGRVKNKYRDLFASSEDIFGNSNQDFRQQQQYSNQPNRLSVKYKSAVNLPQVNDEYEGRSYYIDDQQLDKYRNNYQNEESYENSYQNGYANEYDNEYEVNYPSDYHQQLDYQQQQQQLANEQIENEEQYDEETNDNQLVETTKQKKLIFIPKDQPAPTHLLTNSGLERRREMNTTNSAYGKELQCPALNLASDTNNLYEYRYTIGNHKYFTKKSSIS